MTRTNKREIKIEKIVLSVGGTADKLEKGVKLLKSISGMEPKRIASKKRIPGFGVTPGLETGAKVTLRGLKIQPLLIRLLQAKNNETSEKSIKNNHFSFGIHEYIEIPNMEYQREVGILGLNIAVDFARDGLRVKRKKVKRGRIPKKQEVSKEEIIEHMQKNYNLKLKEK